MAHGSFDFPWWERVRADIELQPMPPGTRELVYDLLTQYEIVRPDSGHQQNALARLESMWLAHAIRPQDGHDDWTFRKTSALVQLAQRDLLGVLWGDVD